MDGIDIRLPDTPFDFVHYNISDNCMRVNVFVDISGIDILRTFTAYVELDPCQYVIQAGFEKLNTIVILFEYDWGMNTIVNCLK
jgi:hypothetical protein